MSGAKTIITDIGKIKIAKAAETGLPVKVKYFAVGDGAGETYQPTGIETSLREEKWRSGVNSIFVNPENPQELFINTTIPENIGGFFIREYGTFDEDGDMISIGTCDAIYKPTLDDKQPIIRLDCRMSHTLQNVSDVKIDVDLTAYVTYEYLLTNDWETAGQQNFKLRPTFNNKGLALLEEVDAAKLPDINNDVVGTVKVAQKNGKASVMEFLNNGKKIIEVNAETGYIQTATPSEQDVSNNLATMEALARAISNIPMYPQVGDMKYSFYPTNHGNANGEWIIANGQVIPEKYTRARAIFGANLPNLTGRTLAMAGNGHKAGEIAGTDSVTLTEAQLANHTHAITGGNHIHDVNDKTHGHGFNPLSMDFGGKSSNWTPSKGGGTRPGDYQDAISKGGANVTMQYSGDNGAWYSPLKNNPSGSNQAHSNIQPTCYVENIFIYCC